MIILNEKEYAEECLRTRTIGDKPFHTLSILAKYYYHCLRYRKKKITELLIDFMSKYYPRYDVNKSSWNESIEKIAKNAGKYTLYEIDGIWITSKELEVVDNIENKTLSRLAFTLLCLAKLNNIKNPNNNNWVNTDAKEIFDIARISCNASSRYNKLGKLQILGLLEFPKKNDNLSRRVLYIDNSGEKVLFISDFRELGYEYLQYIGETFIQCQECGRLMRNNRAGNKRYCSECSAYTPIKYKTIVCVDCGKTFEVKSKNNATKRCKECQDQRNRGKKHDWYEENKAN